MCRYNGNTANDLEFGDEFGGDVGADVSSGTSFTLFDELKACLGVFSRRSRHSFITTSSILCHLLVNLDQLRDVVLRRRLCFLANHLQNATLSE